MVLKVSVCTCIVLTILLCKISSINAKGFRFTPRFRSSKSTSFVFIHGGFSSPSSNADVECTNISDPSVTLYCKGNQKCCGEDHTSCCELKEDSKGFWCLFLIIVVLICVCCYFVDNDDDDVEDRARWKNCARNCPERSYFLPGEAIPLPPPPPKENQFTPSAPPPPYQKHHHDAKVLNV